MIKAIHMICHREGGSSRGLHTTATDELYRSECWQIRNGDPQLLVNGYIYFHESSNKPAYLAGRIMDVEPWPLASGKMGIAFMILIQSEIGQSWRGTKPSPKRPHGGIIDADFSSEVSDPVVVLSFASTSKP